MDMDIDKTHELLSYINSPLSRDSIDVIYAGHNIVFERSDLYKDFVLSMVTLVFDTYMGDDITSRIDRLKHFDWCWNKTIENFKLEGIVFEPTNELYDYFINFMVEIFYSEDKDGEDNIPMEIVRLWRYTFNYNVIKTRADLDTYLEVYKMFEKSLIRG
jgi:hypothetical protein